VLGAEVDRDPERRGEQEHDRRQRRPAHEDEGEGDDDGGDEDQSGENDRPVQAVEVRARDQGHGQQSFGNGEHAERGEQERSAVWQQHENRAERAHDRGHLSQVSVSH
jgi:hypothetical protein